MPQNIFTQTKTALCDFSWRNMNRHLLITDGAPEDPGNHFTQDWLMNLLELPIRVWVTEK